MIYLIKRNKCNVKTNVENREIVVMIFVKFSSPLNCHGVIAFFSLQVLIDEYSSFLLARLIERQDSNSNTYSTRHHMFIMFLFTFSLSSLSHCLCRLISHADVANVKSYLIVSSILRKITIIFINVNLDKFRLQQQRFALSLGSIISLYFMFMFSEVEEYEQLY
jgi:hypothetical protein